MSDVSAESFGEDREISTASTDDARDAIGRLLHYADAPLVAVETRDQRAAPEHHRSGRKPWGLWVSVEGEHDWRSWCESESFRDTTKQVCHEVTLAPDANILRLVGACDLLDFTREYGYDPYDGRYSYTMVGIRWDLVADKYDGIIIAPYVWSLRLDDRVSWYYGWDCASGCIWNAHAVASLRLCAPNSESGSVVLAVESSRFIPTAVAVSTYTVARPTGDAEP